MIDRGRMSQPHGNVAVQSFARVELVCVYLLQPHSGELYYVFGSMPANRPYRDDQDLPFMQRMVDVWSSFARTFNPNPDPGFLSARGFTSTAQQLAAQPKWEPVTKANLHGKPVQQLQWESVMMPFGQQDQCEFLGFPLTFYG